MYSGSKITKTSIFYTNFKYDSLDLSDMIAYTSRFWYLWTRVMYITGKAGSTRLKVPTKTQNTLLAINFLHFHLYSKIL
jgi:hypothetical protein